MANHDELLEQLKENAPSECQACGGPLELEPVNLEDYQGGKLYLMEKVPAVVCQSCGEVWVPEPVMAEFEKMIETAKAHKNVSAKKVKVHKTKKEAKKK